MAHRKVHIEVVCQWPQFGSKYAITIILKTVTDLVILLVKENNVFDQNLCIVDGLNWVKGTKKIILVSLFSDSLFCIAV